jgi:hypothetical protein
MNKYIQFNLIPAIRRWLAPPVFDGDEAKTRRAVLLNVIVIVSFLSTLMMIVGAVLGHNVPDSSLISAVVWFFLLLLFRRLLYHGRLTLVTLGLTGPILF